MGFYNDKFNQINLLKYLMTLGARSGDDKVYKSKIEKIFKEIEEYDKNTRDSIELTIEELKLYNGTNGKPAYIAVGENIYDLSNISHKFSIQHKDVPLGEDVSEIFNKCHMGKEELLKGLPLVGKIITIRDLVEFTSQDLLKYNGKNGMKAYVAINSIVYDVTNVPLLKMPPHANLGWGTDLSGQFQVCHGTNTGILKNVPIVGKLIKEREENIVNVEDKLISDRKENIGISEELGQSNNGKVSDQKINNRFL